MQTRYHKLAPISFPRLNCNISSQQFSLSLTLCFIRKLRLTPWARSATSSTTASPTLWSGLDRVAGGKHGVTSVKLNVHAAIMHIQCI